MATHSAHKALRSDLRVAYLSPVLLLFFGPGYILSHQNFHGILIYTAQTPHHISEATFCAAFNSLRLNLKTMYLFLIAED